VCKFIRDESAIVLEPGKEYLVESRLLTLAQKENIVSLDELVNRLRSQPKCGLDRKVLDAMTTNETSFFRDIHPFEALKKNVLPKLIALRAAQRRLTFWCGASSSGQEPYSVLMLINEHFPELKDWDFKFVATDICGAVLERARAGRFSQLEVNRGLPATLLVKYFSRKGEEWEIREDLRRRVEFRELNLIGDWGCVPAVDLILLRNVMIYFDIETKKTILGKARRLLHPSGFLLLGGAESTFNIDDAFDRVVFDKTTFHQLKPI
jgi:chemotaxis protein methyltransferase CheR